MELKRNNVYSHLASDHYHYWEDGGATYHHRYSSWVNVRGQEGDPWKGQVADPDAREYLRFQYAGLLSQCDHYLAKVIDFMDAHDTRNCPVMRIPSTGPVGRAPDLFETKLFDIENDRDQTQPLDDPAVEAQMIDKLVRVMADNAAPLEQYERLGIRPPKI